MNYNIDKQKRLYELLLKAMYSDNSDYIQEQLSKIYTIIYNNNIEKTEMKYLEEVKKHE